LEAAQAGLNWSIVLKKRDRYRRAFSNFDPERVARYSGCIDKRTTEVTCFRYRDVRRLGIHKG
jgi:3-methyladenine DNA glycosylase Tag